MTEKIRLNKFMSDSGICSRREADKFIETGHVTVNGHRAKIGETVSKHDKVMLNGNLIEAKTGTDFVFLAFNKPIGVISTTELGVKDSIIDYIGYHERIFPVGRLDKDSQGLIFLTNNGDIVNKILRAGNRHEKEYLVTVNKPITDDFLKKMAGGVPILGKVTKKCKITRESVFIFKIVLIQGLNRQIRRMCEYFDYEVQKLERIRIMNISLKGLPLGEWRQLESAEIESIMTAIANSTAEPRTKIKEQRSKNKDTENKTKEDTRTRSQDFEVLHSKSDLKEKSISKTSQNNKTNRALVDNPKAKELRGKTKKSMEKRPGAAHGKSTDSNFNKSRKK